MSPRAVRRAAERTALKLTRQAEKPAESQTMNEIIKQPFDMPSVSTLAPPAEGRAVSARNATKHGCCADETLILPTESLSDFKSLEAAYLSSYRPKGETERHILNDAVRADWFYQRASRTVAEVEADLFTAEPNPSQWTEAQQRTLGRFIRYQTTRQNALTRCRKALEDFRRHRLAEQIKEEKLALAQTKHAVVKQKNTPEPTWKEHLAGMREKAVAMGFTPPDFETN